MNGVIKNMTWILFLQLLLSACSFTEEPALCPYNVRLEYWYAGYPDENVLPMRVNNLQEFLFDEEGNLLRRLNLRGDSLLGHTDELSPGKYHIVVWGNLTDGNKVCTLGNETKYEDMRLVANRQADDYSENTPRLYYAESELDIRQKGMFFKRIYVTHCHADLQITVMWRIAKPEFKDRLYMRMRGISSSYGFMEDYHFDAPNEAGPYQIPLIENRLVAHETSAAENYNDEVVGEFISYRFTNSTHQLWSLWCGNEKVLGELDLQRYFTRTTDMDYNVEQEFHLLVIVEEDQIIVTEISGDDWEEGGIIG